MTNIRSFLLTLALTTLATMPLVAMNEELTPQTPEIYTKMLSFIKLNNGYGLIDHLVQLTHSHGADTSSLMLQICLNNVDTTIDKIYIGYGSVLHWAVYSRHIKVVQALLGAAQNPYDYACITDRNHNATPLHWATRYGDVDIVLMLLATARSTEDARNLINMKNSSWQTSLNCAILENNTEIIQIMKAYLTMDLESNELQQFLLNKQYSFEFQLGSLQIEMEACLKELDQQLEPI